MTLVTLLTSGVMIACGASGALALHEAALQRVAEQVVSRTFKLLVDLHEPDPKAASMQAATLEQRGWHHHNPGGPVALRAGTFVEVTGAFNYAERGLFLEVARAAEEGARRDDEARTRVRFRIMVEAEGADARAQETEAIDLIRRVLEPAAEPSPP